MKISLPDLCLVVLIGPSGAGKSTFARRHFAASEILSSDVFRAMVRDDERDQSATADAFDALHYVAAKRLAAGRLTVVDATNIRPEDRKPLIELAKRFHVFPVAIVLNLPLRVCLDRSRARDDRPGALQFVPRQHSTMRTGLRGRAAKGLLEEGFRYVHVLHEEADVDGVELERTRLWANRRDDRGPFDLIGDVHGCLEELTELLGRLGYEDTSGVWRHPAGRRALFLGDLVDRGPSNVGVLRLVMDMVQAGAAVCVPGNHDAKLLRALQGGKVKLTHGLDRTMAEFEALDPEDRAALTQRAIRFIDGLVSHLVLDRGRLVVAHAGMKAEYQGRSSGTVRTFALYGETTGEVDEYGLPVRYPWAQDYRGEAMVVYGHTPVVEAEWLNRTMCIDTGCVFGGKLTALRYPELELVQVPARQVWYEPIRPMIPPSDPRTAQQQHDEVLDLGDLLGKRTIETRYGPGVQVRGEEMAAAIEVMSRFAEDPRWVVYLPPTMSPSDTSEREGTLEHPEEAIAYYAEEGVRQLVCEEKHMGSRAVVIVCRDAEVARRRFGVNDGRDGVILSRTGRAFFDDEATASALLGRVRAAIDAAGWWSRLESDWFVLDCELMPWSAKAQELLRAQYAPVGRAATLSMGASARALQQAVARGLPLEAQAERVGARLEAAQAFDVAWRRYCWEVRSVDELRLAPFHLLASEGRVHTDQDHLWHMETLAELAAHDPVLVATRHRLVDLDVPGSAEAAVAWWEELTAAGGEGMVVKPRPFLVRGARGLLQPAVKCRGREYLRIIYGPEYLLPDHLQRLRKRGLSTKRSLAMRELLLGLEGLERFVRREPLRRVHECALGVLALESDPVDPRL